MSVIFTDSGCDVPAEIVREFDIKVINMPFCLGDKDYFEKFDLPLCEFYSSVRSGVPIATSSLNPQIYCEFFEPFLKEGEDIIYVHFSGAMSGTFAQLEKAITELRERFPERNIDAVDTRNISMGSGFLAWEVAKRNKKGMPHRELVQWANQNKSNFAVYFYVDDLGFLKRGGRISSATAFFGGILNIKPLLHCFNDGKLDKIGKASGRKKAIMELAGYAKQAGKMVYDYPIVILHADAEEQAQELKALLQQELGEKAEILVDWVGTTVGTHAGPGTVGLFFHAPQRPAL